MNSQSPLAAYNERYTCKSATLKSESICELTLREVHGVSYF